MMQGIRLLRYVPTVSAMSFGDTKNDMVSNIVRCFALVGVVFCAYNSYDMVWIAAFGLTGEVAALITSVVRLNIMHGVRARFAANPALLYVMLIAIAYTTKDIADFPKNGVKFIAIISLYYTIAIISVMTFFVLVRQNAMEAFKSLKKATAQ